MFSTASRLLATLAALAAAIPLLAAPEPAGAQDLDARQREHLYYRVKPAVVLVEWEATAEVEINGQRRPESSGGMGTGWIITPDGYVVTNAHVVQGYHELAEQKVELIRLAMERAGVFRGLSGEDQEYLLLASLPGDIRSEAGLSPVRPRRAPARRGAPTPRGVPGPGQQPDAEAPTPVAVRIVSPVSAQLRIVMQNGRSYPANIRALSPSIGPRPGKGRFASHVGVSESGRDVAVLKVAASDLPVVKLGNSERVELGATVHAAGYPGVVSRHTSLGSGSRLQTSFSEGRISSLKVDVQGSELLQMTAPISWGNSGGPVFNDAGEVIGMSTLISIAENPVPHSVQGFNFAVPANVVREFVQQAGVELSKESLFTRIWERALQEYYSGRYVAASSEFNRALSVLPGLPDAERLRRFALDEIERGGGTGQKVVVGDSGNGSGGPQGLPVEQTTPLTESTDTDGFPWLIGGLLALALLLVPLGLVMRRRNPGATAAPAPRSLPSGPTPGHLVVGSGPRRGERIAIPVRGLTIGRDPTRNQVVLSDESVSRTHALVLPSGENAGILVRNLSHTNPTLVNDEPVEETTLRNGDRIKVGSSTIVYESE